MTETEVEEQQDADAPPEEQKLTTVNPLAIQNNMQVITRLCVLSTINECVRLRDAELAAEHPSACAEQICLCCVFSRFTLKCWIRAVAGAPEVPASHFFLLCSRILSSLFTGAATGVLGVEGTHGFALYFIQHAALTLVFGMKCQGTPKKYFLNGCVVSEDLIYKFYLIAVMCSGRFLRSISMQRLTSTQCLDLMKYVCQAMPM
jgi:hypothetical protein